MSEKVKLHYQGKETETVRLQYRRTGKIKICAHILIVSLLLVSGVFFPYLREKTDCDVILRCPDGSVPCHRLLLASLSPLLCSVLSGDTWDEAITVMMPDLSVQDLETFFENLYDGSNEVSSTSIKIFSLFGLEKGKKNTIVPQKIRSSNSKEEPPPKMKSILKPLKTKKKKRASDSENAVKQEHEDSKDSLSMDNEDFLDPMDNVESEIKEPEVKIKEENQEVEDSGDIVDTDEEAKKRQRNLNFGDQDRIENDPIWNHFTNVDCAKFNYTYGNVQCNHCGKTLKFSSVSHHIRSVHNILLDRPSRFKKPLAMSRKNKTSWIWEYLEIDPDNQFRCICKLCNKNISRASTEKHLRSMHDLGDKILCSICGKSFRDKNSRNTHELTHTKNYQYFCTECGKGFYQNYQLTEHIERFHNKSDQKPHQCCECGKSFRVKRDLSVHMSSGCVENGPSEAPIYTEEQIAKKPHKCPICEKRFAKESYFNLHMKIHSGESKIECEKCGKSFADAYYLKAHMNVVHSDIKPYSCAVCSKSFKELKVLKTHMAVHSEERPFGCQKCNKSYKSRGALRIHACSAEGI